MVLGSIAKVYRILQKEISEDIEMLKEIISHHSNKYMKKQLRKKQKNKIFSKIKRINSFDKYNLYAMQYDQLEDIQEWKYTHQSEDYDYKYILFLKRQLATFRQQNDVKQTIQTIKAHPFRNIANMLNPDLYKQSKIGTKKLIEDFIIEYENSMKFIENSDQLTYEEKLQFFQETRHILGKTALILSGGGSLGMYHNGVIKILSQLDLLPQIITGASAGSVIAAFFCTKTNQEIRTIFNEKLMGNFDEFKPERIGSFTSMIERYLTKGHFLTSETILKSMQDNIGNITFLEAYTKTGKILNISVTAYNKNSQSLVLNFLTSPHVTISSAVMCSCAVPGVYQKSELQAIDDQGKLVPYNPQGTKYVDGSFYSDVPFMRLAELFNVTNIIVSQTNPFMVPIKDISQETEYKSLIMLSLLKFFDFMKNLILKEIKHRMSQIQLVGLIPHRSKKYLNLFNQEYIGNITIYPPIFIDRFIKILKNPTTIEEVEHYVHHGAQQTFKKISLIKASLSLEQIVEKSYQNLIAQENKKNQLLTIDLHQNDHGKLNFQTIQ